MKFIHLADCHLADNFDFSSKEANKIRFLNKKSFYSILENNRDVDFLLIAGDLYERNYFTLSDYKELFQKIRDFGKDVFYLAGNHDFIDYKNSHILESRPENFHIFSTSDWEYYELGDVRIYGRSYADRIINYDFDYNIDLDGDYFNILLAHGDVNMNQSSYLNFDLNRLKEMRFSYVGLGHIHKREDFGANIYYAGSIEPHDFTDTYSYGYNLYDNGEVYQIDSSLMKFYDLEIATEDYKNPEELVEYVNSTFLDKVNFLRLRLDKDLDKKYLAMINASYIDLIIKDALDFENLIKLFPNSLLDKYRQKFGGSLNEIEKEALRLGLDAIYRSRDE